MLLKILIYFSLTFVKSATGLPTLHEFSTIDRREPANATAILQELLEGYDKRTRPFAPNKPVKVEVYGSIQQFKEIKESTMEFTSSVFLKQLWKDPRLVHMVNGTLSLNGEEVTKRIWTPDTYVPNANLFSIHAPNQLAVIYNDGTVYYSARVSIVATCQMFLQRFPMDVQECVLKIESYAYNNDHMQLIWKPGDKPMSVRNTQMAEFEIAKIECTRTNVTYNAGQYSSLRALFRFKRRMGFYIIQVYLPSLIITILSWLSFYIDPRDIGERVSLGITTILTIVFLLGTNNSSMPRVSYAKAIDWYLITSFMFVFATLIESLVVFKFSRYDDAVKENEEKRTNIIEEVVGYKPNNAMKEESVKMDALKQQEATSPCLVDENGETRSLRIAFAHNDLHRCNRNSTTPKCVPRSARYKSECRFSLSRMIDRVCRVLFPVCFAIMNMLYWYLSALT